MIKSIKNFFIKKKRVNKVKVLLRSKAKRNSKTTKEKPLKTSGVFVDFKEREKYYKDLFSVCNQQ